MKGIHLKFSLTWTTFTLCRRMAWSIISSPISKFHITMHKLSYKSAEIFNATAVFTLSHLNQWTDLSLARGFASIRSAYLMQQILLHLHQYSARHSLYTHIHTHTNIYTEHLVVSRSRRFAPTSSLRADVVASGPRWHRYKDTYANPWISWTEEAGNSFSQKPNRMLLFWQSTLKVSILFSVLNFC